MTEPKEPEQKPDEEAEAEKEGEQKKKPIHEQISGRFEELKKHEHVQKVYTFAKTNTRDTLAYVALFIGIILLFFQAFWGGLIIGAVAGFYFADTVIHWLRNFNEYLETEGVVKVIILTGVAIGFFIGAPAYCLGAVAAIGIKFLLFGEAKP